MNSNKKIWMGTVVFIVAIAVLCACIVLFTPQGHSSFAFSLGGRAMLQNTTELAITENTMLEITAYSDNIYFFESDNNQCVIKEYYKTSNPKDLAEITMTGKQVTVQGSKRNMFILFGWGFGDDRIEVYLPKAYVTEISTTVSSGNIRSDLSFTGNSLSLAANSGNISWNSVQAEEVWLKTSSGNIKVEDVTGKVTAKANSGNITISRADGLVTAGASSGNVKVLEVTGGADISISSGNAHLVVAKLTDNINVHTTSGNIKIQVPKESEFTIEADTNSGNIDTDFDEVLSYNKKGNSASGTVGPNPQYEIITNASSGNIKVTY